MRLLSLYMLLLMAACIPKEPGFDFIEVKGQEVITSHRLPIIFQVPSNFTIFGEHDFIEVHDNVPFKVSSATFTSESEMLIVLAEEQLDPEGIFTYDLPMDTINNYLVYRRSGCFNLFEETEQDMKENSYLRFLKENDFNFDQGLNMVQFILINEKQSAEIVLSFVMLQAECNDTTPPVDYAKRMLSSFEILN